MKLEIVLDGKSTRLERSGATFQYTRGEGVQAEPPAPLEYSAIEVSPGSWSVLIGGRSYSAIVASANEIVINGRTFAVEVFDPREMRGRKASGAGEGRQQIKAMMPGKVVRVLVNEGDSVEAGQGLIVVEAMKMQNEIKSPKAGRVAQVKTKADSTVAAGEVLLVIE